MKRSWTWCFLGLVLFVSAALSQAPQTEQTVAALEQKWVQAVKAHNPDMLAQLLADKFVTTGNDGKVQNKAEAVADFTANKIDSAALDDLKVTVFGDVAIATGAFKVKGTDGSGKSFDVDERYTDTWVKMPNGQWQCVASHSSPITM